MDSSLLASQGFLGLRCVKIPRYQNGFGFTLRHFIVYPPELYSEDGDTEGHHGYENGIGQSRLHKVTEPVDTIFVKSVKENSPAVYAGLCVGDRIVSVNGETIVGKSYDQVVQLIQKSRELLCLEVSPKQYDTLQLFYEEQAYRPETNQRPYEPVTPPTAEPLYHYPVHQQGNASFHPNDYHYPNRSYDTADYPRVNNMSSSHSSHPPTQFFSHLPRPIPYNSSAVWASTPARNGDRPSNPGSLSHSSKSSSANQQRPQPQGYYPFNHSFDKSTALWKVRERDEPHSGAKSADSILGECGDDTAIYRSPLRSESMECLSEINTSGDKSWKKAGPGYRYSISTAKALGSSGASQPSDFRNTMVVTMSSTNSGQSSRHPQDPSSLYSDGTAPGFDASLSGYETQIRDRIRRSCEQKEEFLKRPNQPFWSSSFTTQPPPPPYPKELYAQPQKFSKVPWPPENIIPAFTAAQQPSQPNVADISSRSGVSRAERRTKTNNVTVINVQHSGPDSVSSGSSCRPETSNSDSWSPIDHQPESDNAIEKPRSETYSSSDLLSMYELPKNRTMVVGSRKLHCDPPPGWKPDLASLTTYQPPHAPPLSANSRSVESNDVFLPSGSNETEIDISTVSDNVILRKKGLEPESESERLVRRVSYLKATSSPIDMERKSASPTSPVKSFEVMSCKPNFPPPGGTGRRRSMASKLSAEFFPKGRIYKLKQFFEDRTQPTTSLFKFYVDSPTADELGLGKSDRLIDASEIMRDGKVHFKIRIGENKRGNYNRSWRQGFAQVRRSGYLYLSKERQLKEAVTGSEESVIISVSIRDGVLIEYAEDYTKRKNVLRIRTSFLPDDEANFPSSLNTDTYPTSGSITTASIAHLTVEVLLQGEDQNDLTLWFNCLQRLLENNNCKNESSISITTKGIIFGSEFGSKSKSFFTSLLPSPGTPVQSSAPGEKTGREGSNSTIPSSSNTLAPTSAGGGVSTAASPKVKTWKGKVAKQWKKVHDIIDTSNDNKPSSPYASLPPAGATFGINLENCPPGEHNPFIPRVIEYSIDLVEKKGIEMVGLYRIPGNNASVALLTERLNRGEEPNPEKDARWSDVHVVASLIKSFLRRLPDPLLTNDRYPAFIQAADEEESLCLARIKELIRSLPKHNYETLKAVVMHLRHVSEKGEANRMDARNLAIVFGPTIVRTAGDNLVESMVADMKNQCKIVEAFVLHAENLFDVPGTNTIPPVVLRHPPKESTKSDDAVNPLDAQQAQSPLTPSPETAKKEELKASLLKAAKRKVSAKENQPLELKVPLSFDSSESHRPVDEKGFIRSYAGLNEVTERRIRNFELETKAMLYRDDRSPNSSIINVGANKPIKGMDDLRQQQIKLDDELRKAKDDLETEDIFDQIADNPSMLVHHRERTLGMCVSNPGPFNLSNSSLSSSNSNSTAPSLLTSSLPAWPTGSRLGPQPFRNSMPPQSLPPKPPSLAANSSSLNSSFELVPAKAQAQASIRRVNSIDRLQGSLPASDSAVNDNSAKFDRLTNKESFKRLRRPDGKLISSTPKQLGGSLDSLNDINSRIKTDDLSPRSSDGSDMVTTLTKTLDKKLQNLRTQFSGARIGDDESQNEFQGEPSPQDESIPEIPKDESPTNENPEASPTDPPGKEHDHSPISNCTLPALPSQNHFLKNGRRRHSLIERRKSSFDSPTKEIQAISNDEHSLHNSDPKTKENHSDGTKVHKPSSKRLSKECRRRHSLSGATDILSLVFRGSEKLSVHRDRDSEEKNNSKTLSNEALLSALKNASILESHV